MLAQIVLDKSIGVYMLCGESKFDFLIQVCVINAVDFEVMIEIFFIPTWNICWMTIFSLSIQASPGMMMKIIIIVISAKFVVEHRYGPELVRFWYYTSA